MALMAMRDSRWSPLTHPGAGFYINATNPKWAKYRMYDLITKELPEVLKEANLGLVRNVAWRCIAHELGSLSPSQSCMTQMECAVPALENEIGCIVPPVVDRARDGFGVERTINELTRS